MNQLCGPRFARKGKELAHRAGSDPGSILAQGQRFKVKKPRAKRDGEEAEKRFNRVRGHLHLTKLVESLKTFAIEQRSEVA